MTKAKIEKLLDDLTLGLKVDPEIRLDVKSELRSHLDTKIEEGIKAGLSEKESEKQALKAFGDIIQISDGIADANTVKMSLKARLRVLAGFLLVPAVIICALISFDPTRLQIGLVPSVLTSTSSDYMTTLIDHDKVFWFFDRYSPEENFILSAKPKELLGRFPENKMYLANYMINLLAQSNESPNWRKKMFAELKIAQQKDPDNALYNYITAGLLLEKACKTECIYLNSKEKDRKTEYSIEIKNRKLMNQAVKEYLKGTQKKYYRTHIMDMLNCRLDIMGQPKNVIENIRQIVISAGIFLPQLNYLRSIARGSWLYAGILQKEGKQQEALKIVAPWKTYLKQTTEDTNTLIGVLVAAAIARVGKKEIPEIYRKAGEIKLAEKAKRELESIVAPMKKHRTELKDNISKEQLKKTGILAAMLLPALGKVDLAEDDFAISRKIEYTAVEKAGVIVLNMFLMIVMIGSLLTALYWRVRSKQKALLLTPSMKVIAKIFLWGIIFPLTAYVLISISGILGGHQYNVAVNKMSIGAQFIILLALIPSVIFVLTRKHVRQRCLELDIIYPEVQNSKLQRLISIIMITILLSMVLLALLPIPSMERLMLPDSSFLFYLKVENIILAGTGIFALYIVMLIVGCFTTMFSREKYALYYGALAKTLVPIFALAMIFMTLIIIPYLEWREAELISKDKVIYGQPSAATHAEYQITQRLKAAILKALE